MDAHRQKVHGIFSRIAGKYDLMNTILSFNLDKAWRARTLEVAAPKGAERWLDACCGTGKITLELRRMLGEHGEVRNLGDVKWFNFINSQGVLEQLNVQK